MHAFKFEQNLIMETNKLRFFETANTCRSIKVALVVGITIYHKIHVSSSVCYTAGAVPKLAKKLSTSKKLTILQLQR
jgi:hypothetical protein